jgi:prepilin-type N-terminal cleavage/methylation domain-containing protein
MRATDKQAFTLIELSIVLVIIGLIVSGILFGKELIATASYRQALKQMESISTAVHSFSIKYNCKPGDCAKATQFWQARTDGICTSHGCAINQTFIGTCDGGDDSIVDNNYSDGSVSGEGWTFWQQLGLAGLVRGQYVGACYHQGSTSYAYFKDVTQPALSNLDTGLWPKGRYVIINGVIYTDSSAMRQGYTLINPISPSGVFYMDSKIDDGYPARGLVQTGTITPTTDPTTYNPAIPNCETSYDPVTARYNLNANEPLCGMISLIAF